MNSVLKCILGCRMGQLVLKLSDNDQDLTIIVPEVEVTQIFRNSVASALTSLVDSANVKLLEAVLLNASPSPLPCMVDGPDLCTCEPQPTHLLATSLLLSPDSAHSLHGKSGKRRNTCGGSRGRPSSRSGGHPAKLSEVNFQS